MLDTHSAMAELVLGKELASRPHVKRERSPVELMREQWAILFRDWVFKNWSVRLCLRKD